MGPREGDWKPRRHCLQELRTWHQDPQCLDQRSSNSKDEESDAGSDGASGYGKVTGREG